MYILSRNMGIQHNLKYLCMTHLAEKGNVAYKQIVLNVLLLFFLLLSTVLRIR